MRKFTLCTGLLVVLFLAIGIYSGTAQAQTPPDLSIWDNTVWQLKHTSKGYYFGSTLTNSPPTMKFAQSTAVYGIFSLGIDPGTAYLNVWEYEKGDSTCDYFMTIPMTYVAGDNLNFVAKFDASEDESWIAGLVYFSGVAEGDVLTKGKVASLGIVASMPEYMFPNDLAVAGSTLKGKMISEEAMKCSIIR